MAGRVRTQLGSAISKPPVKGYQIGKQHDTAPWGRGSGTTDDKRHVCGKSPAQRQDLSNSLGSGRFDTAEGHGGGGHLSCESSNLLDRGVDAEYQRTPPGQGKH